METEVLERLAAWGCDISSALERFDGDKELYVECLNIFQRDKSFEDLPLFLNNKDYDEAFNAVHSLKGVAGNLSLGPLLEAISNLSDRLKVGDYAMAGENYNKIVSAKKEYDDIMKEGSKG